MFENKSLVDIKKGKERNFAFTFACVFIIIAIYHYFYNQTNHSWLWILAIIFFILGIVWPKIFYIPNKLWIGFGILLGKIIAPIIMGLIFFLIVTPIGIILRLLGKDVLNQKIVKSEKSYWIKRKKSLQSMKNQF